LKVRLLGTGTSQGVPLLGCRCKVCLSTDTRDKRLRSSALITEDGRRLVIDCGPDFRQQMLSAHVSHLDGILLTHEHNDHIIGLDDIRPYNFQSGKPMDIFADERVLDELSHRFPYVFNTLDKYPGAPDVNKKIISKGIPFEWGIKQILPIEVMHGQLSVLAFRFGQMAYVTDVNHISPTSMGLLEGLDVLILGVLQPQTHYSHFNIEEGLQMIEALKPKQTYLIHCNHKIGLAAEANRLLPENVQLGYDGQIIEAHW
jgi:phosphoribosyl 1,2-cyclic phosphate phosphodiesterase